MIMELNFIDLQRLAVNSEIVKDGVTIKIGRPILPAVNTPATKGDEYVLFSLDSSDSRSKEFKWYANVAR